MYSYLKAFYPLIWTYILVAIDLSISSQSLYYWAKWVGSSMDIQCL